MCIFIWVIKIYGQTSLMKSTLLLFIDTITRGPVGSLTSIQSL